MTMKTLVTLASLFACITCRGATNNDSFVWEKWIKSVDGGILHHSYLISVTIADDVDRNDLVTELLRQISTNNCSGHKIADGLRRQAFLKDGLRDNDVLALSLAQIEKIPFEIYTFENDEQRQDKINKLLVVVDQKHRHRQLLIMLSSGSLAAVALVGGGVLLWRLWHAHH